MTISRDSAVTRMVDYEPPLSDERAGEAGVPPTPAPALPRHLHVVPDPGVPSHRRRAAAAFADAALRTVLEVMDQRRPGNQLRPLMIGGLADTVVTLGRAHADGPNLRGTAAVLRRVRLQAVDTHESAFEVAAAYSRAPRMHALACRVELVTTVRGARWQVVALHIG
ncbi:MAG: Rv3235 family protein [Mycobacterium sp.]